MRSLYIAGFLLLLASAAPLAHAVTTPPVLNGPLIAGQTVISGAGNPTTSTVQTQIFVCVRALAPNAALDCSSAPEPISGGVSGQNFVLTTGTGSFNVTLAAKLIAGYSVYVTQVVASAPLMTSVLTVGQPTNEREHTDFVAGSLLSANGSNYSQGNMFLALNYDRTIWRPGWYTGKDFRCISTNTNPPGVARVTGTQTPTRTCLANRHPGLNTFFQARLTSIPVNTTTTTTTATTTTGSTPATTTATGTSVGSFLSAQKTGQFIVGGFMPFLFGKVPANAVKTDTFYIGPVASFGFSTPTSTTGSATTSTAASSASTTTAVTTPTAVSGTSSQLYNYWMGGLRIGTANLGSGSLHTTHYFDMGVGKYSNLQSLVCTAPPCTTDGKPLSSINPVDITKERRMIGYRLVFEGYMEVQTTGGSSLILGIRSNYGPGLFNHRTGMDINNRAKDDLSFLLGYKFDVSKLLAGIPVLGN